MSLVGGLGSRGAAESVEPALCPQPSRSPVHALTHAPEDRGTLVSKVGPTAAAHCATSGTSVYLQVLRHLALLKFTESRFIFINLV